MKEIKVDFMFAHYDLSELCYIIAQNVEDEDVKKFIESLIDDYEYAFVLKALYDPTLLVKDNDENISEEELSTIYDDYTQFFNTQAKKLDLKLNIDFDINSYDNIVANFIKGIVLPVLKDMGEKTKHVYIEVMKKSREHFIEMFNPAHRPIAAYVINNTPLTRLPNCYEELFEGVHSEQVKDLVKAALWKMTPQELEEVIDADCDIYNCIDVARTLAREIYNKKEFPVKRIGSMYYVGNAKYTDKEKAVVDLPEGKIVLPKGIWKVYYIDRTKPDKIKEEYFYTSSEEMFRKKKMSSNYEIVAEYTFDNGNSVAIYKHDGTLIMPDDIDIEMYSSYEQRRKANVFPFLFTKVTRSYYMTDTSIIIKRAQEEDLVFVKKLFHVGNDKRDNTLELLIQPPAGDWLFMHSFTRKTAYRVTNLVDNEDTNILDLFNKIVIVVEGDTITFEKVKE